MLVRLLHQYVLPNHEWACFGIVVGLFAINRVRGLLAINTIRSLFDSLGSCGARILNSDI